MTNILRITFVFVLAAVAITAPPVAVDAVASDCTTTTDGAGNTSTCCTYPATDSWLEGWEETCCCTIENGACGTITCVSYPAGSGPSGGGPGIGGLLK